MTDNTNIIQLPTPKHVLAERYRAAYKRAEVSRGEWIADVLLMAEVLCEARDQFDSDRAFSIWIAENDLGFHNDHDRAALINMQRNRELARIVLQETNRTSLQYIWLKEIEPRVAHISKPLIPTPIAQNPVQITLEVTPSVSEPAIIPVTLSTEPPKTRSLGNKHSFRRRERGEQVAAIYRNRALHSRIANAVDRKGGAKIWDLILQAIDAGFLTANNICPVEITIGILFPHSPVHFRQSRVLTHKDDLRIVEEQIMPAALANRDAILADPNRIDQIIRDHANQLRQAAIAAQQASKLEAAKAIMKAGEHEVRLFGKVFWPLVKEDWDSALAYDFEQLRSAVWIFRELHSMSRSTSDPSPRSCALHIRHAVKFMWRYADKPMRKVLHLIVDFSRALEANPTGHLDAGERLPTMPVLEGDD